MEDIVLIGYGGHGKSVADVIERSGQYHIIGYTEVEEDPAAFYPYLGKDTRLEFYFRQGVRYAAMGIGYMGHGKLRDELFQYASGIGYSFPVIADPSAVISATAKIGEGVFIGKQAVINTHAVVGEMCIINTKAVLEHECRVGAYSHIAVGALVCGQTEIGTHCFLGAGSITIQNITIGNNVFVRAGAVTTKDIQEER